MQQKYLIVWVLKKYANLNAKSFKFLSVALTVWVLVYSVGLSSLTQMI